MSANVQTLHSGTVSADGAGSAAGGFAGYDSATVEVNVTAFDPTSIVFFVQGNYGTGWADLAASVSITGMGRHLISVTGGGTASVPFAATDKTMTAATTKTVALPSRLRLAWDHTGAGNVTFTAIITAK